MNAQRLISEFRRAVHYNLGATLTRWFNNVERSKTAKVKQTAEYRSLSRHTELRHLLSKARARLHYEKQAMFDRWAGVIHRDNEEILDNITGSSGFMNGMPRHDRRQVLRTGRKPPDKEIDSLVKRLHTIANEKLNNRPRSMERWISNHSKLKERIRLNTILDLAATRISDILKSRLRRDFGLLSRGFRPANVDKNLNLSHEFSEKFQNDEN